LNGHYQWEQDGDLRDILLSVPSKGVPVAPLIAARADIWLGGVVFGKVMAHTKEVNTCMEWELFSNTAMVCFYFLP